MKFTTRGLVQTGLLLAVCIASQFFKNLSVYLTGPIVNTTIILAVLAVGLWSGILIGVIAPVSAFFISTHYGRHSPHVSCYYGRKYYPRGMCAVFLFKKERLRQKQHKQRLRFSKADHGSDLGLRSESRIYGGGNCTHPASLLRKQYRRKTSETRGSARSACHRKDHLFPDPAHHSPDRKPSCLSRLDSPQKIPGKRGLIPFHPPI